MSKIFLLFVLHAVITCSNNASAQKFTEHKKFTGKYFSGTGDTAYLHLLDQAYRMMRPDPVLENLSFLYKPSWNGFVEGPTWKYWWIQNSFGPTYTMLPFMDKAYQAFIYNSQAMWFNVIGNGVRKDNNNFVGPVGVLVDCARDSDTDYYCKQGDYKVNIHDWCFGFTTAGILLQSELMLIRRKPDEIKYYLPLLESSAAFIDSRRDTIKNIFLVGTAGNLLAPSYNGSGKLKDDGTYEMAYLAEISVNYIAALDRLIELEKMMKNKDKVALYVERREKVKNGLTNFITPEGYFIRSLDKDGTKHGQYGSATHGYFEATPNHDAMAFRVVNDEQASRIFKKIQSIPELRMHKLILPNYPSYDDMYDTAGLFTFGEWVNGGHWTTCEARMQLGYYRVGAFNDAADGFKEILKRSYHFRLDNPLKRFGAKEYQPDLPVNCVYDCWGAPGGFLRGLFEYEYKADGIFLYPHIPGGIISMQQNFPVFFGNTKIYISTHGSGEINAVLINNKSLKNFTGKCIFLQPDRNEQTLYVSIGMGGASPLQQSNIINKPWKFTIPDDGSFWDINLLREKNDTLRTTSNTIDSLKRVARFYQLLTAEKIEDSYEGKHAELILESVQAIYDRRRLKQFKKIQRLPLNAQVAADQLYIDAVVKQTEGLFQYFEKYSILGNQAHIKIANLWVKSN